jgi:hypothetical protein
MPPIDRDARQQRREAARPVACPLPAEEGRLADAGAPSAAGAAAGAGAAAAPPPPPEEEPGRAFDRGPAEGVRMEKRS